MSLFFFFSSRRRHTRFDCDWSSDVCSSDLGGFQFVLEDRAGKDVKFLSDNLNKFLVAARKRPEIGMISSTFIPSVPEQYINVDQDKVLKQGVAISDVYQTIQAYKIGRAHV